MTRIAVIGAGCAGLQSAAILLNKYQCQVVVFDQQTSVGGTWAGENLTTHSMASGTTGFIGFPVPDELLAGNNRGLSRAVMKQYIELFIEKVGLRTKIRLCTRVACIDQVSPSKVELSLEDGGTGNLYKETFDYVMNTGFGCSPAPAPNYPRSDLHAGPRVLASHQLTQQELEHMKQVGETVVVLGGSKAAMDVIQELQTNDIPTHWVARQTNSFLLYNTPSRDGKTPRLSSAALRLYHAVGHSVANYSPEASIKILRAKHLLVNAHPETADGAGGAFQLELIDEELLKVSQQVLFTHGQVVSLSSTGVVVTDARSSSRRRSSKSMKERNSPDEISCGIVIGAFDKRTIPVLPECRRDGDLVDVQSADHLYQLAVHPDLPRLYFAGSHISSSFEMLNAYHSTQHAIILWAKLLDRQELWSRTSEEEILVRRAMAGKSQRPYVKHFDRHGSYATSLQYLMMVDGLYSRAGHTSRQNFGLASFLWNYALGRKIAEPYNRDPTDTEVRMALGTSIIQGHGVVPIAEHLLPLRSRERLPERMSAGIDKNAVLVPLL
jgi:hypothetical protein